MKNKKLFSSPKEINLKGKEKYPNLFEPFEIKLENGKSITLSNRMHFPACGLGRANKNGEITKYLFNFYTALAKNGCGLIYLGVALVSDNTEIVPGTMKLYRDDQIPPLKKLVDAIREYGSEPAIQIGHCGLQGNTLFTKNKYVLGPSDDVPCLAAKQKDKNYKIKVMTEEDIQQIIGNFINSAKKACQAGIKIIQLHAPHGYLLGSFLSPETNLRTDKWGGDVENRARIVTEIIKGIKKEISEDVVVDVRISAHEFNKNGLTPKHYKNMIPLFENAGAKIISVSLGKIDGFLNTYFQPRHITDQYVKFAKEIASYISTGTTLSYAGFLRDLANGEAALEKGEINLVGFARSQLANWNFIPDSLLEKLDNKNKCILCSACLGTLMQMNKSHCVQNPKMRSSLVYILRKSLIKTLKGFVSKEQLEETRKLISETSRIEI